MEVKQVAVDDVNYRKDLYPRLDTNAVTVQKYAEDLSVLPPIEVNQHNELIDGWHRWTAHKKNKVDTIAVMVTPTGSDAELLELAIERNAKHGMQLSQEDKQSVARKIYHVTPEKGRDEKKKHLGKILSVSDRTIRDWLSRIDKDSKEARNKRIFDMWLACYTQQEIADAVGCPQRTVADALADSADLPKSLKPAADHATGFTPPIYNVWKFKEKSPGSKHFGNTEPTILDNLTYLYTDPFDIVFDPFGGGGSTIDVCKKRFRRYWIADRIVTPEMEGKIREHDIASGLPSLRWKDVRLAYLDPPYWKQAEKKYSEDAADLANMSLEDFNKALSGLIQGLAKKMSAGHIALIIQPTQWNAPEHGYTDHVADMMKAVRLPVAMRVSCPYESQQCNAQMVDWAKDNKQLLVLTRELIIWKVGE